MRRGLTGVPMNELVHGGTTATRRTALALALVALLGSLVTTAWWLVRVPYWSERYGEAAGIASAALGAASIAAGWVVLRRVRRGGAGRRGAAVVAIVIGALALVLSAMVVDLIFARTYVALGVVM
jgi:hypothetical protein